MSGGSPFTALEATLDERRRQVEEALRRLAGSGRAPAVQAALEDSLFAPAKRLRPIVSLMVAEVFRADPRRVLPAGGAIEMVHTASLILDDLPSMDDARSRRGRPACHVAHGEATAILAAFALLSRAYEILAEGWPDGVDDVVVMLDAQQAYAAHPEAEIYWGAYLGTEDEILRSGRVCEVADDIVRTRAEARERHGWIMDTYLLRRAD